MTNRRDRMYWSSGDKPLGSQIASEHERRPVPRYPKNDSGGGAQWLVYLVIAVIGIVFSLAASQGWLEKLAEVFSR